MKKCLLALILCLITLPALATDKYLFHPTIRTEIVTISPCCNIIKITIENLRNFKSNKFRIEFNSDGTEIKIIGKSRKKTKNFYTYRNVISEIIQLPAPVPKCLWDNHISYKKNSDSIYFTYYNHSTSDLVIRIPIGYIATDADVAVIE